MRISDWSSDVCSSDLRRFLHPAHRLADVAGEGLVGAEEEMKVRFDAEDELLHEIADRRIGGQAERLVADKVADMVGAARRQIGRASCRERVCQYVSISVVAGSLHTTVTTDNDTVSRYY